MVLRKDDSKLTEGQPQEDLTLEQVRTRVPLLRRVVQDAAEAYGNRKKSKEFLDELVVISKKFNSPEINETMGRLRRDVVALDRELEEYEKEVRDLGGLLEDSEKGLAYFPSVRAQREVYLIWELSEPDLISWHGREQKFADRLPIEFPEGSQASR